MYWDLTKQPVLRKVEYSLCEHTCCFYEGIRVYWNACKVIAFDILITYIIFDTNPSYET